MRIKIDSDVFNITRRIKEIDNSYFVMYNLSSHKYEIHSSKNKSTYCLTVPYNQLDARTIELIHKTAIRNYDAIMREIDLHNSKIESSKIEQEKEKNDYKIRELLKYSKIQSEEINQAFKMDWA